MHHFRKEIKTAYGDSTFYVNSVQSEHGLCFHVSTIINNKAVIFYMVKQSDNWKIVNPANMEWLLLVEKQLSDAITKHILLIRKGEN